jgi:lactate dehydrogenase-like 2-hydroxyacid dehydrogenase
MLRADFPVLYLGEGMARIRDAVAERFPVHALDGLPPEIAETIRCVVVTWHTIPVDDAFMARCPKLELVASFGVGYDHIDARAAKARGIVVTHTPGVLDDEVADTAFGLLISAVREMGPAERYLRQGQWAARGPYPLTASLRGRTMGVLGLGRIGKAIATRAQAFGLKVIYTGRKAQADVAYPFHQTLLDMARACDILMIAAPGGADTRHMVGAEVLAALGPHGILINISRGSLVDETALVAALTEKRILAAGLDVFENEPHVPDALMKLDNVVLLPHVGSASHATRDAMADLVVANVFSWADGKGPVSPVPETSGKA